MSNEVDTSEELVGEFNGLLVLICGIALESVFERIVFGGKGSISGQQPCREILQAHCKAILIRIINIRSKELGQTLGIFQRLIQLGVVNLECSILLERKSDLRQTAELTTTTPGPDKIRRIADCRFTAVESPCRVPAVLVSLS